MTEKGAGEFSWICWFCVLVRVLVAISSDKWAVVYYVKNWIILVIQTVCNRVWEKGYKQMGNLGACQGTVTRCCGMDSWMNNYNGIEMVWSWTIDWSSRGFSLGKLQWKGYWLSGMVLQVSHFSTSVWDKGEPLCIPVGSLDTKIYNCCYIC